MAIPYSGGSVSQTNSGPFQNDGWFANWTNFALPAGVSLPADAVITAMYPVMRGSYSGGLNSFFSVAMPPTGAFKDVLGSATSIGTSLSLLASQTETIKISSSLALGDVGQNYLSVSQIGIAIYYTSATPTIDNAIDPPHAVPSGTGVAWAYPFSANCGADNPMGGPPFPNGGAQVWKTVRTALLSAPFSAAPPPNAPYILASIDSSPLTVKIRSIKRNGDQKFTITAIDYDPRVYSIPTPVDISATSSGGSSGGSASTPDPTPPTPTTPPTDVLTSSDPGYGGSSAPTGAVGPGIAVGPETVTFTGTSGTLAHTPFAGTLVLYRNGLMEPNWTLSTATITLGFTPGIGDIFIAYYRY